MHPGRPTSASSFEICNAISHPLTTIDRPPHIHRLSRLFEPCSSELLSPRHSQLTHFAHIALTPRCRAFKNLPPKTRAGVGVAILAWGGVGLYLSDRAEEEYPATEEDKAKLSQYTPKIIVVDNDKTQGR